MIPRACASTIRAAAAVYRCGATRGRMAGVMRWSSSASPPSDGGGKVRSPWEVAPNHAMEQSRSVEELEEFLLEQEALADSDDDVNTATGEVGGPRGSRRGAEPTRFGDWENKGRVSD